MVWRDSNFDNFPFLDQLILERAISLKRKPLDMINERSNSIGNSFAMGASKQVSNDVSFNSDLFLEGDENQQNGFPF